MSTTATVEAIGHATAVLRCMREVYQEITGLSPLRQQPQRQCLDVVQQYQRGEVARSEVVDAFATMNQGEAALPPRTFEVGEHVYYYYIHSVDGGGYVDGRGVVQHYNKRGEIVVRVGPRCYRTTPMKRARIELRKEYADAAVITRTENGVMLDDQSYPTLAAALRAANTLGYRKWYGNGERWPDWPKRIPPHYRSRDEIRH